MKALFLLTDFSLCPAWQREISCLSSSYKNINPITGSLPLCSHINLICNLSPKGPTPKYWDLQLQHLNLVHNKHIVKRRSDVNKSVWLYFIFMKNFPVWWINYTEKNHSIYPKSVTTFGSTLLATVYFTNWHLTPVYDLYLHVINTIKKRCIWNPLSFIIRPILLF